MSQSASRRYFNKDVSELNISESAVIAAITQNPSRYNPVSNPDQNKKRRAKVLKNMLDQEYISQKEYDEAMKDKVYDRIQVANLEVADDNVTSYFVDAADRSGDPDIESMKKVIRKHRHTKHSTVEG